MTLYEHRKKARRLVWEVVDVDCAIVYHADNSEERDFFRESIEIMNHRVLVKEVQI